MEKNTRIIMIYQVSNHIISSLGLSTEENYVAIKQGISGLKYDETSFNVSEGIMASQLNDEILNQAFASIHPKPLEKYTRLEKAAIFSIYKALKKTIINPASEKVLFILSTTKGNVELLDKNKSKLYDSERVYLWKSAQLISHFFNNPNEPMVVSNACISGVAAQLYALQELKNKHFDYVIVTGVDCLSEFIISGFQSFKSLSTDICKPFDKNRCGLNLGEAAATIIYGKSDDNQHLPDNTMVLLSGAIANDANHISGPSRTGAGLSIAIEKAIQHTNTEDIAFINAHGTATPYNDDMESMAIAANNLQHLPVNSLKGFFGHTLGTAGIIETIVSGEALLDHTILKTNGLENPETVCPLYVPMKNESCNKTHFLKLISGFGGCNAALLLGKK